ncbi:aminotransferase class V-fold PLP-dependent enzyme [Pendulispora albinea]|uniref:Aminotransferase class V-fold PLP-dependent enzyme n=1 Tax=Pendulispora albinea TaxID=2741071 RepID=A0ABZ2MA75_9BACT
MFVYLDYASLVPPVREALDAMHAAAESGWGHPKALHGIGARAQYVLEQARQQVADYAGAMPQEIVFVGSGREALACGFGLALELAPAAMPIVSSRLEHPSVLALVERAARAGRVVHWLGLPEGVPNEEDAAALREPSLVVLAMCNHELGTMLDVTAVSPQSIRVIDAVQAAPWVSLDTLNDERTFYALSGSKLGAPMGIGAVRVPSHVHYAAVNRRSVLESDGPPWITAIGLGAACAARAPRREPALARARLVAERLLRGLRDIEPRLLVNGAEGARLGPIANVSFPDLSGKSLVESLGLERICISHTAACRARHSDASPVVRAAYANFPARADGATRWSVSEHVTDDDVGRALEVTGRVLRNRRTARGHETPR